MDSMAMYRQMRLRPAISMGMHAHGHERVDELGIRLPPDEGLHASHRCSEHETQMIDVEPLDKHRMRRPDHVIVRVAGKLHPQTVGRFAGLPVADLIREDDEVSSDVQGLPGPKQHVRKHRVEQRMRIPAGAMDQQDGIDGVSRRVAPRLTERYVMKPQIRQRLARAEAEVVDVVDAVADGPVRRRILRLRNLRAGNTYRGGDEYDDGAKHELSRTELTRSREQRPPLPVAGRCGGRGHVQAPWR